MNRQSYFNYIHEKLTVLMYQVQQNGKLNLLDLNIYSENFFADLCNIIFDYKLVNMNAIKQNIESIDLKDDINKVLIQVTSTCTKHKIESTLNKSSLAEYSKKGYIIQFIFINNMAKTLKSKDFINPHNISFDSKKDIFDINDILRIIMNMKIDHQKVLYDFIRKELGEEPNIHKIDSNLTRIISILANEDFDEVENDINLNEYSINKKIEFNNLRTTKDIINDYKIYYKKVDEKYQEFDRQGKNKSFSVFQAIKKQYISLLAEEKYNEDQIFLNVENNLIEIIQNSRNYVEIPYEELEMCVSILVVDAFIRCKIFKNPEGYEYVIT